MPRFSTYIDEYGYFRTCEGDAGNMHIWTAFAVYAGRITPEQGVEMITACRIRPGVYQRHPFYFSEDQDSVDNQVARAYVFKRAGRKDLIAETLDRINANQGIVLNEPGVHWFRGFFWKNLSLISQLQQGAGRLDWLYFARAITIVWSGLWALAVGSKPDPWYLTLLSLRDSGFVRRIFLVLLKFRYKTIADLFAHGMRNDPNHEIVIAMRALKSPL
jgi:hypothetical protein